MTAALRPNLRKSLLLSLQAIDLQLSRKLLVSPTSFIGTTARPSSVKTSLVMAASKPKRSVKQSLHPDFAYEFPGLFSPTEIDAQLSPSGAAHLTEHVSSTTPKVAKKSVKSSKIHDQELECLKQHNLQLELQILTRKEKHAGVSENTIQPHPHPHPHIPETDTCGPIQKEQLQEKLLASLMSDLTPPSHAELHQLTNPTFPVMHQLKGNTKGPSVFSAKVRWNMINLTFQNLCLPFSSLLLNSRNNSIQT